MKPLTPSATSDAVATFNAASVSQYNLSVSDNCTRDLNENVTYSEYSKGSSGSTLVVVCLGKQANACKKGRLPLKGRVGATWLAAWER